MKNFRKLIAMLTSGAIMLTGANGMLTIKQI